MTFWVSASVAVALFWVSGFWAGRWHARYRLENARGGFITIPPAVRVENWCYPDPPAVSLSHPLIPDPSGYDDGGEFSPRVDPIARLTSVTLEMTHKALRS